MWVLWVPLRCKSGCNSCELGGLGVGIDGLFSTCSDEVSFRGCLSILSPEQPEKQKRDRNIMRIRPEFIETFPLTLFLNARLLMNFAEELVCFYRFLYLNNCINLIRSL